MSSNNCCNRGYERTIIKTPNIHTSLYCRNVFYQNVFQARIQIAIDLDFVLQKGRLWNVDDTDVQDLLLIVGKKLTRSMNGKGDCNTKKKY